MTENKQRALEILNRMGIEFSIDEHPPVYTIEEMDVLGLGENGSVVKNLFLRDAKGKRHFLVVLSKDKQVDLKKLQDSIGCSKLSFASEDRLNTYLKLTKGAVTPLGIINDEQRCVEVVLDKDLEGEAKLGIHPNDNSATVWLRWDDLVRLINEHGNPVTILDI